MHHKPWLNDKIENQEKYNGKAKKNIRNKKNKDQIEKNNIRQVVIE